jgi:hypothetical protein
MLSRVPCAGHVTKHDLPAIEETIQVTYGLSIDELERQWKEYFTK